jgi:hypothetical protein
VSPLKVLEHALVAMLKAVNEIVLPLLSPADGKV